MDRRRRHSADPKRAMCNGGSICYKDPKTGHGPQSSYPYTSDRPIDLTKPIDSTGPETTQRENDTGSNLDAPRAVFEIVVGAIQKNSVKRRTRRDDRRIINAESALQGIAMGTRKLTRTCMWIWSKPVINALQSSIGYYSEFVMMKDNWPLGIHEPYTVLVHHYSWIDNFVKQNGCVGPDECSTKAKKEPDPEFDTTAAVKDMTALRDFLKERHETYILTSEAYLSQSVPVLTFDMVPYVFRPGIDVYVKYSGDVYVCVVGSVSDNTGGHGQYPPSAKGRLKLYWLYLWYLDTDGFAMRRTAEERGIPYFQDSREILSFPVCPAKIWDAHDGGARREQILQRSKTHVEALRAGHLHIQYDGFDSITSNRVRGKMVVDYIRPQGADRDLMNLDLTNPVEDSGTTFESYDHLTAFGYHTNNNARSTRMRSRRRHRSTNYSEGVTVQEHGPIQYPQFSVVPTRKRLTRGRIHTSIGLTDSSKDMLELTDHQKLLMFPTAPAFSLSTKQWHLIRTSHIHKVEVSNESIENLVIDKAALETVRALSNRQQNTSNRWSADFIAGKGVGQIILLHGPPGVGKTYTVESIAEWLQRPLLALTVYDIGTVETKVEQELVRWFDLAEAWDAVLLVDEADISLEQRKGRDLARNGLVTAFLRRMEYFKGLLFLTTNRVGQIDDAFISRVHVAIEYEALNTVTREKIWNGFFKKLKKERGGKIIVPAGAQQYVIKQETDLNGREIRNALQTAITLAEFQAHESGTYTEDEPIIVEESHFRDVIDMSDKFHKYVASIRREDEKKRANARGDRNDHGQP